MILVTSSYTIVLRGGIDELVLIDLDEEKAKGEAMVMNHGLPYSKTPLGIFAPIS